MQKEYQTPDIRNFAIVGHGSSGKTLLTEAMLACSGEINRIGSIENGTTASDYHRDEKQRGISIHSSILTTDWLGKKFNMIDTPGYLDFLSDGLGSLRVGDFALVTIHANQGVEVGTEQAWRYADRYRLPKVIVVNAFDKEHTDFEGTLAELRERFGNHVFPMTIPINAGPDFNQLLDVMRSEVVEYARDDSGKYDEKPAEGELKDRVKALHRELIEYVAESDESLMEQFFEQDGLSEEDLRGHIHEAVQNETFIPLFCTSALHDIGIARLMDFIAKYGSSPMDRKVVHADDAQGNDVEVKLLDDETVAYVFKTVSETHVGEMSFFRVYSGEVRTNSELFNSTRGISEKIGQLYRLNGKDRTNVDVVHAGDIGAVLKLKDTHTGNTLCNAGHAVTIKPTEYPLPCIHGALRLVNKGDEEKISEGLKVLHEEDPTFVHRVDEETLETIISGQGEMHLTVIKDSLMRRFGVDIELAEPRVPFRETIRSRAESKYRHKKQSGGAGQFAEVWLRIEPGERDAGVEFRNSLVGTNVDRAFVPSVEKGISSACTEGILAGYRVVDVKIDFYDGKTHPVDSKDVAFQIAGKEGFKDAFLAAKPYLLEPIINVEIRIPEAYTGDVMGDISSRRGRILGMDQNGTLQIINAHVPQLELYRYSSTLRALTGGRGMHREAFSHYEEMPRDLQEKVIAKHQ